MKEIKYYSSFHEYLYKNLNSEQVELLPDRLGCSPHRRTTIMKRPEVARHDEVLFFSHLLKRSVPDLLDTYGLGAQGMSEREIRLHRRIRKQASQPAVSE